MTRSRGIWMLIVLAGEMENYGGKGSTFRAAKATSEGVERPRGLERAAKIAGQWKTVLLIGGMILYKLFGNGQRENG